LTFSIFQTELLDRRKDNLPGLVAQKFPQFIGILCMMNVTDQGRPLYECLVQLTVEIRAIHLDDDCRVIHLRMPRQNSREKQHRKRFSRTSGMPQYANLPVSSWSSCANSVFDGKPNA